MVLFSALSERTQSEAMRMIRCTRNTSLRIQHHRVSFPAVDTFHSLQMPLSSSAQYVDMHYSYKTRFGVRRQMPLNINNQHRGRSVADGSILIGQCSAASTKPLPQAQFQSRLAR